MNINLHRLLATLGLLLLTIAAGRASYESTVLNDHPLAYYALDLTVDNEGIATDLSGNTNDSAYYNLTPSAGPSAYIPNAAYFDGASPEAFRVYVEEKIEEVRRFLMGEQRLLFINAWNEWAEGAHLEPDTGFGHRWLEAMRDALAAKRWA